jgi:hypothetical protein
MGHRGHEPFDRVCAGIFFGFAIVDCLLVPKTYNGICNTIEVKALKL